MLNKDNSNRLKFKKGKQKQFLKNVAESLGSLRNVAKFLNLSWGSFWYYLDEQITLSHNMFKKLFPFSMLSEKFVMDMWVEEVLPYNWGKAKGVIETNKVNRKKLESNKVFRKAWVEKCKKGGDKLKGRFIRNWDVGFRKAGKRNVTGPKSERMFNQHEKDIASWLISNNKDYEYEKMVAMNGKFYFPDFTVGNTIIERCGMRTKEYLESLGGKIKNYSTYWNGNVIIVCPEKLSRYIKELIPTGPKIILITEDKLDKMAEIV